MKLNVLKNGGLKDDVDSNTKEVVESLTGYKYEDVWKQNFTQDNLMNSIS